MSNSVVDCSEEISLLDEARFNVEDFSQRWLRARKSAVCSVLTSTAGTLSDEEQNLLQCVSVEQRDAVLRVVFDVSRSLGTSLSRYLGLSLGIKDFAEIIPLTGSPCYGGKWRDHNSAKAVTRSGCDFMKTLGSFGCDYWREALDGLIMGASDDVRLARHRSMGHGDPDCVDVLFYDKGTGPKPGMHRGDVPAEYAQGLAVLARQFQEKGIALQWTGYSEGILFYRMEAGAKPLCGVGGRLIHAALKSAAEKFFPGITLRDGAPLAVIGDAK